MEDKLERFTKIKKAVAELAAEQAKVKAQAELLQKQLSALGIHSIKEAKDKKESLIVECKELEKTIDTNLASLESSLGIK